MSTLRSVVVVAIGGVLVACTFTRSLDYLTNGVDGGDGPGTGDTSSGSTGGGTTSSGDSSSGQLLPAAGSVLAAEQASPTNLAQDGDSVYWTTDAKKVMKVPKASGAAQELVTIPSAALGLAVDPSPNGNVYILLVDGTVKTVPKAGGALAPFANIAKGTALAADEAYVFVTIEDDEAGTDGSLVRYPKAGGAGVPISPPLQTALGDIVLVGDKVLWSASTDAGLLVVNEQPKTTTSTTPSKVYRNTALDEGAEVGIDPTSAGQLAVDETALYWIDELVERPLRLPRMPGVADAKPLLESKITPAAIAVDAKYIYITNPGDAASEIIRIPKDGSPPDKLGPQPNPKQIVADASAIYVAFSGIGAIKPSGGIQKIPTK